MKCWGFNKPGQLGDGNGITGGTYPDGHSNSPVTVSGITTATSISLGADHSCAFLSGETVKCWGLNDSGQLGDLSYTDSNLSVTVRDMWGDVASISLGDYHSCAVMTAGTVKCWGKNDAGQLGDGTTANRNSPGQFGGVLGVTNAKSVASGAHHSCALLDDSDVRCWGDVIASGSLGGVKFAGLTTLRPSTLCTCCENNMLGHGFSVGRACEVE